MDIRVNIEHFVKQGAKCASLAKSPKYDSSRWSFGELSPVVEKKVFTKTGGPRTSGPFDKLCVMLPVTEVVIIVTTVRYPRVFATNRGKVIDRRDANPCEKRTALGRRHESERSWVHIPVLARIFFI